MKALELAVSQKGLLARYRDYTHQPCEVIVSERVSSGEWFEPGIGESSPFPYSAEKRTPSDGPTET